MTLAEVRAAALDRAMVGDDPTAALALAGVVDAVADGTVDDPLTAAMLAVGCVGRDDGPLDADAWRPGSRADRAVVAGAAVAVRRRDLSVERAADLADCSPGTLGAVLRHHQNRD